MQKTLIKIIALVCALLAFPLAGCSSGAAPDGAPAQSKVESAYEESAERIVFDTERGAGSAISHVAIAYAKDGKEVVKQDVNLDDRDATVKAMTELFRLASADFVKYVGAQAAARRDQATGDDRAFLSVQAALFGSPDKAQTGALPGESAYDGACANQNNPVCGWCSNGEKTCCCPQMCVACGPWGCTTIFCGCGPSFMKNC